LKCIYGDLKGITILSLYKQRDLQGGNAFTEVFMTFRHPPVLKRHVFYRAEHAKRFVCIFGGKYSSPATFGEFL
jgi:hypothetical protein